MLNFLLTDLFFCSARLSPDRRKTHHLPVNRVLWILALITLLSLIQIGHAADDSNSGDFSPGNSTFPPGGGSTTPSSPPTKPNPDDQNLATGLKNLNQRINNTDVNKLVQDLQNHNYTGAKSTIDNLNQQLGNPNSPVGSELPTSLKDVIQSTSCTIAGCSVDWNSVSNMVQPSSTDETGVPQGLSGTSPVSAASQLTALSTMTANSDPNLSLLFGSDASQILQLLNSSSSNPNLFQGIPSPPPIIAPSIGSLPPLTGNAGALGVAPQAVGGLPNIFSGVGSPSGLVLIPIVAILSGIIAVMVFRRKSVIGLLKKRTLTGMEIGGPTPHASLDPENPRHAIILSFRRAVGLMLGKGVPKMPFETHREFSTKCETRPEKPYVGRISSIYERAVFSGRIVNQTHVNDARQQVTLIQECEPKKSLTQSKT
jgi:hypothetical protein